MLESNLCTGAVLVESLWNKTIQVEFKNFKNAEKASADALQINANCNEACCKHLLPALHKFGLIF